MRSTRIPPEVWHRFARRTFPRVVRELGLPAATPQEGFSSCPEHHVPIGPVTWICVRCFDEAWDEVGRRFLAVYGDGADELV